MRARRDHVSVRLPLLILIAAPFSPRLSRHTCQRMGLEGIVSKRRDAPYRSGKFRLDQGQMPELARGEQRSRRAV